MKLDKILKESNLVDFVDAEKIGSDLAEAIQSDNSTRSEWLDLNDQWIKLATQVIEEKSTPWPKASNVKYPILSMAAMQFAARAYPALISGQNIVKTVPIGYDATGQKLDKSIRINKHMSYQVLYKMPNWEEDMDRMLMALPIIGTAFKKSYYSPYDATNISEYIDARDVIIDYYAKNLENAQRKTHIIYLSENEIVENIRAGIFADISLGEPSYKYKRSEDLEDHGFTEPSLNKYQPYEVLECHCWLDLDEDGYKEPYIATILSHNNGLLRLIPRFTEDSIVYNTKKEIAKIDPDEYFTGFIFIPDPNSGVYGLGFGTLLGPINEAINTLINQLIDSGTLNNGTMGFLGRGIKLKSGDTRFRPNEWKFTNSTGDDLRKGIYPLPTKDPSNVLYLLLGTLVESGQKLSSTMDIMLGENPGQNQAAHTTMAVLEQGMKVFTAIHKRLYRALAKEFKKLFVLNSKYLDIEEYFTVLDLPNQPTAKIARTDYMVDNFDIMPAGDPNTVSQAQKLVKAQGLLQLMQVFPLNPDVVKRRVLEAQEQPGIEELLKVQPPQPNPELVLKVKELEHKVDYDNKKLAQDAQRIASEAIKDEAQAILSEIKSQILMREAATKELDSRMQIYKNVSESSMRAQEIRNNTQEIKDNTKEKDSNKNEST